MIASKILPCSFCEKPAELNCQRCFEPYCSQYCQINHWLQHKQFCIKMPALVPIKTVTETIALEIAQKNEVTDKEVVVLKTEERTSKNHSPLVSKTPVAPTAYFKNLFENIQSDFTPLRRPRSTTLLPQDESNTTLVNHLSKCEISKKSNLSFELDSPKTPESSETISVIKTNQSSILNTSMSSENKETTKLSIPELNNDLKVNKDALWKYHSSLDQYKAPGKNVKVTVLYIEPNADSLAWVILQENENTFKKIFQHLNITYMDKTLLSELKYDIKSRRRPIKIGDLFITEMPEDKQYYRVMVIKAPKLIRMTVEVRLIDFGEETCVPIQDLYDCLDEYRYLNAYSFCIKFNKPVTDLQIDKEYCIKFLSSKSHQETVMEDYSVIPELVEICLDDEIVEIKTPDIVKIDDMKTVELKLGFNLKLIVLDFSMLTYGFITVAEYTPENIKFYNNICTSVRHYARTQNVTGYEPKKDEVCLAIYEEDENWYRAVCLYGDIEKKEFMLHFIDFGNLQNVHKSKIIPINKEFAELEILANKVYLEDFPSNITKEKLKTIKDKVQKPSIMTKCISKINDQTDSGKYMIKIDI